MMPRYACDGGSIFVDDQVTAREQMDLHMHTKTHHNHGIIYRNSSGCSVWSPGLLGILYRGGWVCFIRFPCVCSFTY